MMILNYDVDRTTRISEVVRTNMNNDYKRSPLTPHKIEDKDKSKSLLFNDIFQKELASRKVVEENEK